MNIEYLSQRLQCSRPDKQECLSTVSQLLEIAFFAREHGLLELDRFFHRERARFNDPFLIKAVSCLVDIGDEALIRQVLYNYITAGNYMGRAFLKNIVIAETVLAIHNRVQVDQIFSFLIPSFFGLECEREILGLYHQFIRDHGYNVSEAAKRLGSEESSPVPEPEAELPAPPGEPLP